MKSITPFLEHVQKRCADYGVSLVLVPRALTRAGDLGEFDDKKKRLVVCVNDAHWLTTLAHEDAHLGQWIDGSFGDDGAYEAFDAWLGGRLKPTARGLLSTVRTIQRCELDAERRALRTIRRFGIADAKEYARTANFHVWQYEASRKLGRWIESSPARVQTMPDRLMRVADIGRLPEGFGL
jgi:hypothetical protein